MPKGILDQNVYVLHHEDMDLEKTCTRKDFIEFSKLAASNISNLLNGKVKKLSGWKLIKVISIQQEKKDEPENSKGKTISKRGRKRSDLNIYKFKHLETETTYHITRHEIVERFDLDKSNIHNLIAGKRKSVNGWMCEGIVRLA